MQDVLHLYSMPGLHTSAFLLSKLFNTSGPCVGCVHYLETPAAVAGQRCSSGHHPLWQQPAGVSGCPDQVKALRLPVAMEIGTACTSVLLQMYHVYLAVFVSNFCFTYQCSWYIRRIQYSRKYCKYFGSFSADRLPNCQI